jgi:hypothetical protein
VTEESPPDPESNVSSNKVDVAKQQKMVETVERILSVLSCFEESAAECISEMLVFFSNGSPLEGVIQANKFIQHVYALFSSIEEIEDALSAAQPGTSIQKSKDPKQLVKKVSRSKCRSFTSSRSFLETKTMLLVLQLQRK